MRYRLKTLKELEQEFGNEWYIDCWTTKNHNNRQNKLYTYPIHDKEWMSFLGREITNREVIRAVLAGELSNSIPLPNLGPDFDLSGYGTFAPGIVTVINDAEETRNAVLSKPESIRNAIRNHLKTIL